MSSIRKRKRARKQIQRRCFREHKKPVGNIATRMFLSAAKYNEFVCNQMLKAYYPEWDIHYEDSYETPTST